MLAVGPAPDAQGLIQEHHMCNNFWNKCLGVGTDANHDKLNETANDTLSNLDERWHFHAHDFVLLQPLEMNLH